MAIVARKHIGMAHVESDIPADLKPRLTATWVGALIKGGCTFICIYPWTVEGLTDRNASLLNVLVQLVRSITGPWIVGGDWNMNPEVVTEAGWPARLKGVIYAPSLRPATTTCTTTSSCTPPSPP